MSAYCCIKLDHLLTLNCVKLHLVGYILEYRPTRVYSSTNPIFMFCCLFNEQGHTYHRLLVVSLSPWGFGFDLTSVHVGFMVDKVALGQVFV